MNCETCQDMQELLVDFADDALPSAEAAQVRQHVKQCPHCRATVDALRQSLEVAEVIWQDNARYVGQIRARRSHRWRYIAAAAGILLAVSILVHRPAHRQPTASVPTLAEIERRIAESGHAARLLARVHQLEAQTSRQDLAVSQYRYILEKYPETTAANSARRKLESLP